MPLRLGLKLYCTLVCLTLLLPCVAYSQSLAGVSPAEAKRVLSVLEVPFTVDAFFKAVEEDDVRVVQLFHIAGLDLSVQESVYGTPAIYKATGFGSYKVFRYLLENGVDVNAASEWNGETALVEAISHRRHEMVYALLNAGALAVRTGVGKVSFGPPATPLEYALQAPDPVLVKALLERGASVNEKYGIFYDQTPLMRAAVDTTAPVVKLLLDAGASVHDVTQDGQTALHFAVGSENFEIVRSLLKAGADVNHAEKNGWSPLLIIAWLGDEYIARLLLEEGANPNAIVRLSEMTMPLKIFEDGGVLRVLIDAFTGGLASLMLAAAYGHKEVVEVLLEHGADSTYIAHGREGSYTAEQLALASGHKVIAEMIRSHQD